MEINHRLLSKNTVSISKIYFWLSVVFFILCIGIVYYADILGNLRGFIGDVVIVMMLFSIGKSIFTITSQNLIISVFLLALTIEMLQYLKIGELFGFQDNPIFQLIFGSIFDMFDIGAYTLGCLLIYAFDLYLSKK